MADPSAVSSALIQKLLADSTLMGLMPGGVYKDAAPHGVTQFVKVTKITDDRIYLFGGTSDDDLFYSVIAVEKSTSSSNAAAAASRMFVLLHNGSLTIPGYSLMWMRLADENATIDFTEPDDANPDERWQQRGWQIGIMVTPS